MLILLTGGAGYIGCVAAEVLLEAGFRIRCLDRLFFGVESVSRLLEDPGFELVRDDIRWFDPELLRGVDMVVDMAALSNDPSGELDPAKTYEINHRGRVRVATLSKKAGIERYVLASTCSVYGSQGPRPLDENSTINPLTTYSKANARAEKDTIRITDRAFSVTVLRLATVYGVSPRMRFDLVVNGMTVSLAQNGTIRLMRDGTQYRPLVHVRDVAESLRLVACADTEDLRGEVFNVGSDDQNYQMLALAEEVGSAVGIEYDLEWYGATDERSYVVSFEKIREVLDLEVTRKPGDGAREIYDSLIRGHLRDTVKTRTVEWYKHLLESDELGSEVAMRGKVL